MRPFTECRIGIHGVCVKNNLLCFYADLPTKCSDFLFYAGVLKASFSQGLKRRFSDKAIAEFMFFSRLCNWISGGSDPTQRLAVLIV